jgi:hypothetical protein
VSAAGPTRDQLQKEADWEATNARLFGVPPGPATAAATAAGLLTLAQRRSDAYAASQETWLAEHNRNAAVAASQESHDRSHERLHWPELGR